MFFQVLVKNFHETPFCGRGQALAKVKNPCTIGASLKNQPNHTYLAVQERMWDLGLSRFRLMNSGVACPKGLTEIALKIFLMLSILMRHTASCSTSPLQKNSLSPSC
jgi:hypothetical protein